MASKCKTVVSHLILDFLKGVMVAFWYTDLQIVFVDTASWLSELLISLLFDTLHPKKRLNEDLMNVTSSMFDFAAIWNYNICMNYESDFVINFLSLSLMYNNMYYNLHIHDKLPNSCVVCGFYTCRGGQHYLYHYWTSIVPGLSECDLLDSCTFLQKSNTLIDSVCNDDMVHA